MSLPLLPLTVNVALLPFAFVAVSMIVVTIFVLSQLLPRDRSPTPLTSMTIGIAALGGGTVLLLALLFVFIDPNGTTAWTWVLLAFNFMMMGPAGLWFVSLMTFRDRTIDRRSWTWPVVLALITTGSEVLMGILFAIAGDAVTPSLTASLAGGLTSVWFYWSMAVIMAALLFWLPIRGVVRGTLAALTAGAVLAPWVTATPELGVLGMAVLMAGALALLYRHLARHGQPTLADLRVLTGLGAAFAVMVAAQAAVVLAPSSEFAALAFGTAMAVVMGGEIASVARHAISPEGPVPGIAWPGAGSVGIPLPGPAREP
jgi:hypothetical protein